MRLYTSYYGNIKKIPKDYFVVSVSGGLPDELKLIVDSWDTKLAPSKSIFFDYKKDRDQEKYSSRFKDEILPKVDWLETLELWEEKANKINKNIESIVICCYETPEDFCHRHILAEHFENEFKTIVEEFGTKNMIRDGYKLIIENNTDILF
jgi:uncharacterized protein YeaO (DUF488 family)